MAEWLGKPRPKLEEMAQYFRETPYVADELLKEKLPRVQVIIPEELKMKFFKAVEKRFGAIKPIYIHQAAQEAIIKWIEENLGE